MKLRQWTRKRKQWALLATAFVMAGCLATPLVKADLLGSVLKGAGIGFLIKQFNRPINDTLNKLTGSAGAPQLESTKVVPIVSVGKGGYVGAAQVSGPQLQVNQVQAVGMLEGSIQGDTIRLKALVPVNTTKLSNGVPLTRVKGVGVSAIIDIKV